MVAGAGFEPRDLRVMSPTSYLAAPPRDKTLRTFKLYYHIVNARFCQLFFCDILKKLYYLFLIILQIVSRVCYNLTMNTDLSLYSGKKICVACSGGRDSMALLHYLHCNAARFDIALSALNCDHGIRGEESARDSAFVRDYCQKYGIPLLSFKAESSLSNEIEARLWRVFRCYALAHLPNDKWESDQNYNSVGARPEIYSPDGKWSGCDAVATAHQMDDNAETVLFNLARGTGLSGMCGIQDDINAFGWSAIHPLVSVSRREIEEYVAANSIPYVDDSTNFSDDYTRNYIRHNVLPALEKAVPGATKSIYRFSRLAAEDEEYFACQVKKIITDNGLCGYKIARCEEPVIFKRAAICIIERYKKKDYTSQHARKLYELQFAANGKKFEFLGLTAVKHGDGVTIYDNACLTVNGREIPFCDYDNAAYFGQPLALGADAEEAEQRARSCGNMPLKTLVVDSENIPQGAVIRTMRPGDKFTRFGGGTKSLGDYFTDKKIPAFIRKAIPVIACGSEVLVVCGVEISDRVKITQSTPRSVYVYIAGADYTKL